MVSNRMTIMNAKFVDIIFDRSLTAIVESIQYKCLLLQTISKAYFTFSKPRLWGSLVLCGGLLNTNRKQSDGGGGTAAPKRLKYYQDFLALLEFDPFDPRTPEHAIH